MSDFFNQMKTLILDKFGFTIAITAVILFETALWVYRRWFRDS